MKKRFMSFFLVLVMVLTVVPVTAAGAQIGLDNFKTVRPYSVNKFQDVPAGSWFYDNVKRSYELNLIDGRSDTSYAPYENMTIAEAIKIATCLHSIYYTGTVTLENGNPWHRIRHYLIGICKLLAAGNKGAVCADFCQCPAKRCAEENQQY